MRSILLNRLVIFLESTELRVKNRNDLAIHYWCNNVEPALIFNDL